MKNVIVMLAVTLVLVSCKVDSPSGGGSSAYLELMSQISVIGTPTRASLEGTSLLVLTDQSRLLALDISSPAYPVEDDNVPCTGVGIGASGDVACVTDGQGLGVWYTAYPWDLQETTYNLLPGATDVQVDGAYAYVAADDNGLLIYDISDPWMTPYEVGDCWTASNAKRVTLSGGNAYVLHDYGMWIVDVTPVNNPFLYTDFSITSPYDVAVRGSYAYIAHDFGLTVVDVSDPYYPNSVSSYTAFGPFKSIALAGNFAFVCSGGNQLQLFNISDPYSPQLLDTYYTMNTSRDVVTDGVYAYVLCDGYIEVLRLDAW